MFVKYYTHQATSVFISVLLYISLDPLIQSLISQFQLKDLRRESIFLNIRSQEKINFFIRNELEIFQVLLISDRLSK